MYGEWRDRLILPGGRDILLGEGKNLIVSSAFVVMAMLMKASGSYGGLMYWALGDGNTTDTPTWDAAITAGTQVPLVTQTTLLQEIYRKAIQAGDLEFVDGTNAVSGVPTNRVRIITTFGASEPSPSVDVDLREWGIFGGDATAAADSGRLINTKQHKTYVKTPSALLERTLYLTF